MNKFPIALYNAYIKMMVGFGLTKEEAKKAFKNVMKQRSASLSYFSCHKIPLNSQFVWSETPEGADYWISLHKGSNPR